LNTEVRQERFAAAPSNTIIGWPVAPPSTENRPIPVAPAVRAAAAVILPDTDGAGGEMDMVTASETTALTMNAITPEEAEKF
jgi:hypothetical protein